MITYSALNRSENKNKVYALAPIVSPVSPGALRLSGVSAFHEKVHKMTINKIALGFSLACLVIWSAIQTLTRTAHADQPVIHETIVLEIEEEWANKFYTNLVLKVYMVDRSAGAPTVEVGDTFAQSDASIRNLGYRLDFAQGSRYHYSR